MSNRAIFSSAPQAVSAAAGNDTHHCQPRATALRHRFLTLVATTALVVAMPGCSGCNQSPEEPPFPQAQSEKAQSDESSQSPSSEQPTSPQDEAASADDCGRDGGNGKQDDGASADNPASSGESGVPGSASGGGNSSGGSLESAPSTPGKASSSNRSASSRGPSRSPAQAAEHARNMKAQAQRAAARGNHAEAFEAAVEGWQSAAAHTSDATCAQLAKELEALLKNYGEATNGSASPLNDDKPIVVQ